MQRKILVYALICVSNADIQEFNCDVNVAGNICLDGGNFQLTPSYQDPDIFGYWSFDFDKYIDQSSYRHLTYRKDIEKTFSAYGFGLAALINQTSSFEAFLVPAWKLKDSTLSFILYFDDIITINKGDIPQQQETQFCAIMDLSENNPPQPGQSIFRVGFDCVSRKILISIQKDEKDVIVLQSNLRVQTQMFYLIHIIMTDKLSLYVNGYGEGSTKIKYNGVFKHIRIGSPGQEVYSKCPKNFIIDELQLNTQPLQKAFIYASSQQFSGYADVLYLGCEECSFEEASQCTGGFHICSSLELYSFAINVAKDMGWVTKTQVQFWSKDTNIDTVQINMGTGLCCRNINYA